MSSKKSRGNSRTALGEFVWVRDGKTLHPARLALPSDFDKLEGANQAMVEIQWTNTGAFQMVTREQVQFPESGRRPRRPPRDKAKEPTKIPASRTINSKPSVKSAAKKSDSTNSPTPSLKQKKKSLQGTPAQLSASTPANEATAGFSADGPKLSGSILSDMEAEKLHVGTRKRLPENRDDIQDQCVKKQKSSHNPLKRSKTAADTKAVPSRAQQPTLAEAGKFKANELPMNAAGVETEIAIPNNLEETSEKTQIRAHKSSTDSEDTATADDGLLDSISAPWSAAKGLVVSKFLGLYNLVRGSSSSRQQEANNLSCMNTD